MKFNVKILSILLLFSTLGYLFTKNIYIKSTYFMPKEYKTIKKIVNKIASKNYLGDRDIPFTIGKGRYMEWTAEELGLCKKDSCYYYRNLNPYKIYSGVNGINLKELSNQSFLFSGIEAYAWNDVIWLSQSTFRTYGKNTNYLACTIGHELSHIISNDHIDQAIKFSNKIKNLNTKENDEKLDEIKSLLEMELSRESETKADLNSTKFIINAGYPKDSCLKEIKFIAERNKWDADTDKENTHPGYLERYNSIKNFIENYNIQKEDINLNKYSWKWKYDRNKNILIFKPN